MVDAGTTRSEQRLASPLKAGRVPQGLCALSTGNYSRHSADKPRAADNRVKAEQTAILRSLTVGAVT